MILNHVRIRHFKSYPSEQDNTRNECIVLLALFSRRVFREWKSIEAISDLSHDGETREIKGKGLKRWSRYSCLLIDIKPKPQNRHF